MALVADEQEPFLSAWVSPSLSAHVPRIPAEVGGVAQRCPDSYFGALTRSTYVAFSRRKPHGVVGHPAVVAGIESNAGAFHT